MNTTSSETLRANAISCVTTTMVMPWDARRRMTSRTSPEISGSRAEVGSSKSMRSGFMQSARAMATRCFCPPESVLTSAPAKSARPTESRLASATFSACPLVIFLSVTGASVQLSSTFMLLNRLKPWKTMPIFSRRALMSTCSAARSLPWNHTWPASGVSSRLMQRRSVDLPEPDAPIMVTTWPGITVRSMPRRTTLLPKDFCSPSTRTTASWGLAASAAAAPTFFSSAMLLLASCLHLVGHAQHGLGLCVEPLGQLAQKPRRRCRHDEVEDCNDEIRVELLVVDARDG